MGWARWALVLAERQERLLQEALERGHFCLCLILVSAQVLHLLGPKMEADLEKKPKVRLGALQNACDEAEME